MNCEEPRAITPVRVTGLDDVASALCRPESLDSVLHGTLCDAPLPAYDKLKEILDRLKAVLFPGYFGPSRVHMESLRYHVTANLDSIYRLLAEQIRRGGCFAGADYTKDCPGCETTSMDIAMRFMPKSEDFWHWTLRLHTREILPHQARERPFSAILPCRP